VAIGPSPHERTADAPKRRHAVAIRGLSRALGIERARLARLLIATLDAERAPEGEIALALVSDRIMRRLNRDYRGIDGTTDVLSFSYVDEPHAGDVLGEIFVSPEVAGRQAREAGCAVAEEVARLSVHGALHVLGYHHDTPVARRRMLSRQKRYVERYFRAT
jgi:probable rRNA maturation factor